MEVFMSAITLSEDKLTDLVSKAAHQAAEDTLVQLITSKDGLSKFLDLVEDIGLGRLMEEGRTGEYVDTVQVVNSLRKK